jgi:hypothetical protein
MTRGHRYPFLRTRSRFSIRRLPFILLSLATISIITLFLLGLFFIANPSKKQTYPLVELGFRACENWETKRITRIPNIVHYILLLPDPTNLNLDFKFFISIYSAHLYFRPETIYIHTDGSLDVFEQARTAGSEWTKRVLAISNLKYHHIEAPIVTTKGVRIELLQHKYDFLRMQILHEYGGIYLDTNAVPLRDVSDLRNSGFANIIGGTVALDIQNSGFLSNSVMLAAPRSAMMELYLKASHEFFSGSKTKLSITLLTDIANRLSAIPHEVLTLQPSAFGPLSWSPADRTRLFKPHFESVAGLDVLGYDGGQNMSTCKDMLGWLIKKEIFGGEEWETDFSSSYVLNAFQGEEIQGWDGRVDLEYVLARQSNYARAVYPAVGHAIREGIILGV